MIGFGGDCCLNCLFCIIVVLRFRFRCLFGCWLVWVLVLDLFLIVDVFVFVDMNAVYFVLVLICIVVCFTVLFDLFCLPVNWLVV